MVEGLGVGPVWVDACKVSKTKYIGNEDWLGKCKGDRGAEEKNWDAVHWGYFFLGEWVDNEIWTRARSKGVSIMLSQAFVLVIILWVNQQVGC